MADKYSRSLVIPQNPRINRKSTLANGLVGFWALGGAGASAYNLVTLADSITDQAASLRVGSPYGIARAFNGSATYMATASTAALVTNEFSASAWIQIDSANYGSTLRSIIGQYDPSANVGWLFEHGGAGVLRLYLSTGSNTATVTPSGTLPNDSGWHHVAVTRSGTSVSFYVDGLLRSTQTSTLSTAFGSPGVSLLIGRNPIFSANFPGNIAATTVHSRAMTAQEVGLMYRSPSMLLEEFPRHYSNHVPISLDGHSVGTSIGDGSPTRIVSLTGDGVGVELGHGVPSVVRSLGGHSVGASIGTGSISKYWGEFHSVGVSIGKASPVILRRLSGRAIGVAIADSRPSVHFSLSGKHVGAAIGIGPLKKFTLPPSSSTGLRVGQYTRPGQTGL
jgi:hypothetical protein